MLEGIATHDSYWYIWGFQFNVFNNNDSSDRIGSKLSFFSNFVKPDSYSTVATTNLIVSWQKAMTPLLDH